MVQKQKDCSLNLWHEGSIILIPKSAKDRMRKENNRSFSHEHKDLKIN